MEFAQPGQMAKQFQMRGSERAERQIEGFEVEQRERYKAGIVERLSARRPG